MKRITTVFFDIGNVLLFFDHTKMHQQLGKLCGRTAEEIRSLTEKEGHHILYENGGITTEHAYAFFRSHSKHRFSIDELILAMSDIFTPNESIYPIVKNLKDNNIRLGLLSNTCEAHFTFICEHFPIIKLFEIPILSFEAKVRKPDKGIYLHALEKGGLKPEECFYLDDIMEYVQVAHSMGFDSECYTDTELLKKHLAERKLG